MNAWRKKAIVVRVGNRHLLVKRRRDRKRVFRQPEFLTGSATQFACSVLSAIDRRDGRGFDVGSKQISQPEGNVMSASTSQNGNGDFQNSIPYAPVAGQREAAAERSKAFPYRFPATGGYWAESFPSRKMRGGCSGSFTLSGG